MARRVLVTGAGSGIGRAVARTLAAAGFEVVGTVRDAARAQALTREAAGSGLSLSFLPLELGSAEQIRALAARLGDGVDVLVNNAGAGELGSVEETDAARVSSQLTVNLLGPLELTRALLPELRERRGRIVWIGSLAGRVPLPFQAHYSAAKAATAALSDALRMELAPYGVAVTCVEPADIATGFTEARRTLVPEGSPYARRLRACLATVEAQERSAPAPEVVAAAVLDVVRSPRPPARRPVGRWARTIALLVRLLPDRVREAIVRRVYRV